MFRGKKFVERDRNKQRKTIHTTQNTNDIIEVKKDFVNIFSDELNLHVFRYLSAADVSICSQVSRKWWRIANDRQLWKSLFLSRFKAPNRPNLTYRLETLQLTQTQTTNLPKPSIITNNEGISENDISDSEDWKNIYRVNHNWQTGNCRVIDFKPYDNLVQDRVQNSFSLLNGYNKNHRFSYNTNSNPLVQFTKHTLLTASSSNHNGNNIPEIHLWRAGKHNEHIDTMKSIILTRIIATHGCKNPIYITCLKLDSNERDDHLGVCKLVSGYSNGGFTIWEFDTLEKDENEKTEYDWKHRELYTIPTISHNASPLIACSLYSPILITCNKDFVLSIYYINFNSRGKEKSSSSKDNKNLFIYENLVECQLIHQLKSFVCWTPIEISIKCSQEKLDQSATNHDVERNVWTSTIVYSAPIYGGGWTAGIQEIKFSTITLLSTKHCSYLPSSTTLPSFISIAPITTITYNSGQLVTAHSDNTLQVYYVLDNGKTLECKHVQTLYGHTGSVMSVAMDENGKLITGAMDQTIKIWDLGWNPEKNYHSQNNNIEHYDDYDNARELKGYQYNHNDDFSFVGLIAQRKKHGECIVTLNDSLNQFNDSSYNIPQSKIKNWGVKWVGFDEGRIVSVYNGETFDDQEAQISKSLPSTSGWPGLSLSKNIITASNSDADMVEEVGIVKVWSFCE